MFGRQSCCFIAFFAQNVLFMLGFWSQALAELTSEHQYGRVGKSITLSPGPIGENISKAHWEYNKQKIADTYADITGDQFTGRLSLDLESYSLTIRELKTTDSGNFSFVSYGADRQRKTYRTRLIIQEVLTQAPTLRVINITKPSNESCVVFLQCGSKYDKDVSYRWTVNSKKSVNGSMLQYRLKPQEGDTTFTCTVFNRVSEASVNKNITCQSPSSFGKQGLQGFLIIAGVAFAVLVSIVVFVIICRYKKTQAAKVTEELTIYAEIDDVSSSKIMKPCSLYDSVEDITRVKPKAQTVYDQIQFNRQQRPHN